MRQALRTGMGRDTGAPSTLLVNLACQRSDRSIKAETVLRDAYEITTIMFCSTWYLLGMSGFWLAAGSAEHDCPQQSYDER